MPFPRSSGILLHPSSFPSRFGIGDIGSEAYRFVDFLAESGQQYWQILPLGPYGDSPYWSNATMAGNPMLISLERLRDDGLLSDGDLASMPAFPVDRIDFERVIPAKLSLLMKAAEAFKAGAASEQQQQFQGFCDSKAYWLDDYALFMALKEHFEGAAWYNWKPEIAHRQPEALEKWRRKLAGKIFCHKFLQYEFFRQWSELKNYTNTRGIQIIGDVAIYVAHDSADVWANRDIFHLDEETNQPTLIAGVPPDYFSATGQLWGTPIYQWDKLQQEEFDWWLLRFHSVLDFVDLFRIDHFRAFAGYWAIPAGETSAINGEWVTGPGEAFFNILEQKLGSLPIIVEDLGVITPDVEALRDKYDFPGMKILQFAFGNGPEDAYLPTHYPRNCIVYTGTHDNDTTVGWFEKLSAREKQNVLQYLGCTSSQEINWDLIRLAMSSVANQAIFPLQDLLGLGSEARMNTPGQDEGNWRWRYRPGALTDEIRDRLKTLTETFGRAPIQS